MAPLPLAASAMGRPGPRGSGFLWHKEVRLRDRAIAWRMATSAWSKHDAEFETDTRSVVREPRPRQETDLSQRIGAL
jgi:hypothetical protein